MSFQSRNLNNLKSVSVPISTYEYGFLGRECPVPECEGYFKIKPGTGLTGEGLNCICPYCGFSGDPNTFWTKQQLEYAKSIAMREVVLALRQDLKSLEFDSGPTGPLGLRISMKLKPGSLPPINSYQEASLETGVTCDLCTLEYSVFGVFAYCPDCGVHNSLQMFRKNLDVVEKLMTLAESMEDADVRRHLIEDGLENVVSMFDGFAREACLVRKSKSTSPAKCEKVSFQNLSSASEAMNGLFGIDLRSLVPDASWITANTRFMQRHLLAHKAGVIDQKFIGEVGTGYGALGRRISIESAEVREFAKIMDALAETFTKALPLPR